MRCSSGVVLFFIICSLISLVLSLQIKRPIQSHSQWSNKNPNPGLYQYQAQDSRNYDPYKGYGNSGGNGIETRSWDYQNDPASSSQVPSGSISSSMMATTEIPYTEQSSDDESSETESTSIESPLLDLDLELDESSNEVRPYYYPFPYYYQTGSNAGLNGQYYSSGFNGQGSGPVNGQGSGPGNGQGSGPSSGQGSGPNPGQGQGSFQGQGNNGPFNGQGNGPIRGQGPGPFLGNGNGQRPNQGQRRPPPTTPQPEEEPTTTETPTTTLAPFKLADVKVPTPFLRIELMTCFTILGAIYGFGFMVLFQSLCVPAAKIAIAVVYIVLLKLKAIQPISLAAALEQLPPT